MKSKSCKFIDLVLAVLGSLCFWYAYYSYDIGQVGMRGGRVFYSESPALFWAFILVIFFIGVYCLYLAISKRLSSTREKMDEQ